MCSRCGSEEESLIHALKECPRAKVVLIHGGFDNTLVEGRFGRCVDWIEEVARSLNKKALSDFVTVLWNIWNSRNNKVFRDIEEDAKVTWDRAAMLNRDFRIFNLVEKPMIPKLVEESGWQKSAGALGTIGTLVLGSSDTISKLGPWSCGNLGQHRQPRPLVMQKPREPLAPGCSDVREPRTPSVT
ncbi:hypothetical protein Gotri_011336 [Gossypium trilobum]|uniref:Reverse transcriptase zinc-binding domain-containing protein n=1 Tax=Gossypium trilobum TaxID=34281 RepID=A0A7J9ETZ3_9ROSI|nr:hypothetical protein [Gossypium trilobum]